MICEIWRGLQYHQMHEQIQKNSLEVFFCLLFLFAWFSVIHITEKKIEQNANVHDSHCTYMLSTLKLIWSLFEVKCLNNESQIKLQNIVKLRHRSRISFVCLFIQHVGVISIHTNVSWKKNCWTLRPVSRAFLS